MKHCPTCDGRGWVHGECNYRPGGSERCQGWMEVMGFRKCAEPWPCPNPRCPAANENATPDAPTQVTEPGRSPE